MDERHFLARTLSLPSDDGSGQHSNTAWIEAFRRTGQGHDGRPTGGGTMTASAGIVTAGHSNIASAFMRRQQPPPMSTTAIPTVEDMFRVWGAERLRAKRQCSPLHSMDQLVSLLCGPAWTRMNRAELTVEGRPPLRPSWYAQHRHVDFTQLDKARTALQCAEPRLPNDGGSIRRRGMSCGLRRRPLQLLLQEYADNLARHPRQNPTVTVQKRLDHVGRPLGTLPRTARPGARWRSRTLDDFLMECAQRFCAFDRGRSRRKRSFVQSVSARHGAHFDRPGRFRNLAGAAKV